MTIIDHSKWLFSLVIFELDAQATVAVNSEKINMNLNNIFINKEKERGKGKSYSMLYDIFTHVKKIYPTITTITLDDMTDRYRATSHHLYLNLGFEYVEDTGPEMIAPYDKVIDRLSQHLKCV
jgi:predicted GNAT superfamily acetyltransferase